METPTFSIASVSYRNVEQTRRFIESIYMTAAKSFEFIMVNNGSVELDSLFREYSRRDNFKVIRNQFNLGIGPAMNQAMRACTTDYIFRSDADVVLQSRGWDQQMIAYVDRFPEVGAVGTSITTGKWIPRRGASWFQRGNDYFFVENEGYVETDLCLSNFMLIPRRTIHAIGNKAKEELPRVRKKVAEIITQQGSRWDGYFRQLGGLINEMTYHAGWWSPEYPYGTDDFHFSMWVRYAGLKITRAPGVLIRHEDESLRPEWKEERDRRVNLGFQQWRASWEVLEDFFDVKSLDYDCWPMAKKYREEQEKILKDQSHLV